MASARSDFQFRVDLVLALARAAREEARRAIKSRTLRSGLEIETDVSSFAAKNVRVFLTLPFHWAIYYHDGRGPVRARPGKWLAFYRDPNDDPRTSHGRLHPRRPEERRRLTRAEFKRDLASGKLIATKFVGPAAPHPFFTEGMAGLRAKADALAVRETDRYVRETLSADRLLFVRDRIVLAL